MCQGYLIRYDGCGHYGTSITTRCRDSPNCKTIGSFQPATNKPDQPGYCNRCSPQMTSHIKPPMHRQMGAPANSPMNSQKHGGILLNGGGPMGGPMNGTAPILGNMNGKISGLMNGNGGTKHRNHSRPPSNPSSIEEKDHQLADQEREIIRLRQIQEKLEGLLVDKNPPNRNSMPPKLQLRGNEKFIVAGILAPFDEGARKLEEGVYRVNEGCRRLVTTPPDKMKQKELDLWRKEREGHDLAWDREVRKEVQNRIECMKTQVRENLETFLASLK